MRYVDLGGKQASVLGFGCGSVMGRVGRGQSLRAMNAAWDAGVTLFDTARSYGYGDAEGLLGEFLAGRRGQAVVVTKFGILPSRQAAWRRWAKPVVRAALRVVPQARGFVRRSTAGEMSEGHFDVATLRSSLEQSLRALRTEYVDALLMHLPPASVFAQEDLMAELMDVVCEGKALRVGASSDDAAVLHHSTEWTSSGAVLQMPWPPLTREGMTWNVGGTDDFVMLNHLFGGKAIADHAATMLAQSVHDKRLDDGLREKLHGDSRQRLAEIVFRTAIEETCADAVVTSMMTLGHVKANVAAMSSETFTALELALLRKRIAGPFSR